MINHRLLTKGSIVVLPCSQCTEKRNCFFGMKTFNSADCTQREVNGKNMDKSKRIEKAEEFIVAYEFGLCLWDICHPEYKNRDLKQPAIERLAGKFEISGK